jgi:hypothetical protein
VTRWLAVGAALVSICAITPVLYWGMTGRAGTPPFELAVHVLSIATPVASALLTWHLARRGRRGGALFSATPIVVMMIALALRFAGPPLSLVALLWLDAYILLVFVTVLGAFGRELLQASPRHAV